MAELEYMQAQTSSENGVEMPKSEKEEVSLWHQRIGIAKKELSEWAERSGANRFCKEYKGDFGLTYQGRRKAINVPPINEVFSYVQSDIAATYNRDPYLSVNAKAGTVLSAKLQETWLNFKWRQLRIKEEMEMEMIDKDLVGYGWHKVGYAVQSEGSGDQLRINQRGVYSVKLDWRDVLWNLGARRPPDDCLWMAQRVVRPLDDIKERFPNAANMKGVQHPDIDKQDYEKSAYKDDIEVGIYYEIWDARKRMIRLVAEGVSDFYLEPPRPWPEYQMEFPFLKYWDFAVPGESRPMSAIAPWEPQILESMYILASAVNHTKRWNRQMIVNNMSLDEATLDRFEDGIDGAILTNAGTGDLDKNVKLLDFGALPTDFYAILDRLNVIKDSTHGQPAFERAGITKTNTRTIGELQLIKSGAKGRVDRKIDRLETHLENIGRHMLMHMKANFDLEETVTVTGDTPEEVIQALGDRFDPITRQVTFSEADIQGDVDVEVKAGSTLPLDKETKMQALEVVLNTLGAVQPQGVSPLLNAVITEFLDGFGIKSLEEAYKQEQELRAMDEEKKSQEGNAEELKSRSQAAKNAAQAQKISAETMKVEKKVFTDDDKEEGRAGE